MNIVEKRNRGTQLAIKTIWPGGASIGQIPVEGSAGRLRPIHPQKAAGATHLIFTIDDHSIVNGRPRESVVPWRVDIVEICSGIPGYVDSVMPQVHVKLIGLKRAPGVASRSHQCPRILAADAIVTGGRGTRLGRFALRQLRKPAAKPDRNLVPRSGL